MLRSRRSTLLLVALLLTPFALSAQTPTEIFARYTKAVDPEGKAASIQGMRSTLTMEIPAAGMSAGVTVVQSRPNRMVLTIEIPGMGQMRQGFDGTTAWASDAMQGPRLLTGAEATSFMDDADMEAMVRTMALFTAVEAAGVITVDADTATCLKLTWKSSRVTTECYSSATGLLVESRAKQESPSGEIDAVARYTDYRVVDGILIPHRVVQSAMGMQQVMTLTAVEFAAQPATLFELPPEIKALKP